ncbi:phage tail tape measure protein [Tardiphaga sp. vice278]|uniref:phage tail tape measure protein n=1 Tax=Tardiphaga sp. vice278 TaxID=2592815 RepID=UPI001162A7BC|nr:phage tail tape measure protein [Tardiphaga sp. vice278]QDM17552.1 phage tail tape measure protein [Tardiphaga sp. vice278]
MSNPTVTATIAVDDKASPALKELARLAKMIAQETAQALKGGSGDALATSFTRANSAAREHVSNLTNIKNLHREIAGLAAGFAGSKVFQGAKAAVANFLPYEKDVRYQTAIQGFGAADQKMLDAQRVAAAKKFGVMPMDTLHAQQAFVTRNFSAAITKAATDQALLLSTALDVPVAESSKIVEGITFSQGIHLHDPATASREMGRSSDRAAVAAKAGAMSPEDVRQFAKYGMGMSTAAGISPDQAYAVGMTLKRANVGGDESGVFMRQMAARLMSPTKQSYEAFAHMGIDYGKYATQGSVSPDAIDASLRRRFGKGLSGAGKESLTQAFGDETRNVLGNREEFAAAVRDAVEAGGEKLSKTDAKHLTSAAVNQYDLSKSGLRGGDLLNDILSKASPKDMQAIIGDKQGGRAVMLLNALDQYREYLAKLGHSDGFAEKIANERMAGAAAAVDRFNASLDTASKKLVEANQGLIEKGANLASGGVAAFLNLSPERLQAISVAGGLGTGAAVLAATSSVFSLGSAASTAAAALLRLPASLAAGTATGAAATAAGAAAAPGAAAAGGLAARGASFLGSAARGLGWAGLTVAAVPFIYDATSDATQGVTRDHTRNKAARDAIRADADERMARDLERVQSESAAAARRGDEAMAPVIARRGGNGAYKRGLSSSLDEQYGGAPGGSQPVTGTVSGSAELHQNMQIEVQPSAYFQGIVQRAEAISNMQLSGKLGTSMQGGDNGTKPSQGPSVNPSGGSH